MRSRFQSHVAGALLLCAAAAWQAPAVRADDDQAAPPAGVDVQARGPVHEAYAEPTDVRPPPGPVVPQQPPDPVAEMPPDEKPAGDNVVWIPGYWAWDNEASTFLWVSGFWRTPPPDRVWTPGYWQQVDGGWQWSPGYWATENVQEVEYLPPPPESIDNGPSTPAPDETSIYVPGCWVYRETRYMWRPGYWVPYNPDWVWIPDHYCWTPAGYLFVAGYWDFPLERRGLLFAPVTFARDVLARRDFVYTPEFVVQPDFLLTALFVRPATEHYYFGDYFDTRYEREGFTPWIDFRVGRHAFDPNFAFYQRRFREDRWAASLRDLYKLRFEGDAPRPPRTWAQQTQVVNKITTNRTENVAINQNINVTNLQMVSALAPIRKTQDLRVTGMAALAGKASDNRTPAPVHTIKLESLPQERRTQFGQEAKRVHEFAAARQKEQAKILSDGGAPTRPDDKPKAVKVQPPPTPARPQETRPEQPNPAPKPPPPPPAPKHEERPVPPQPPAPPKEPPKTPPATPREPTPPTPPREPTNPPPKEPPTTPKEPSPPTPPKEPPTPPTPPREPQVPPREPNPPKEPPPPPPTPPREPNPPTPPKEPPPPPPREPEHRPLPPPELPHPDQPPHQPPPAPMPPREPQPPAPPTSPPSPPAHQPQPPAPPPPAHQPPPKDKDKDKPPPLVLGA